MTSQPHTTVPGLGQDAAAEVVEVLSERLAATIDLQLALKHIHWNVVGPNFLSVHEMLDDHAVAARAMSDDIAERIATLGGVPNGNPGAVVARRSWDDYPLERESVFVHLKQLDTVYDGIVSSHREAIEKVGPLDTVTEGLLIDQTAELEKVQWFVRSFVERSGEDDSLTTPSSATRAADRREAMTDHDADRGPTRREREVAEQVAEDVDTESVGASYEEMTRIGAEVEGEGKID